MFCKQIDGHKIGATNFVDAIAAETSANQYCDVRVVLAKAFSSFTLLDRGIAVLQA